MTAISRDFVLGIDGGGTQTRVLLAAPGGEAVGEGSAGACNIAAMPVPDALASVRAAAEIACTQTETRFKGIGAVCAGVAGFSHALHRAAFTAGLQGLFPGARVTVLPDYAVALAGAVEGSRGVLVIAGTGSVAYGDNGQGKTHRTGGYGYLIDDTGSGYGVGRSALAAVLRAADGTGEATALTARVLEALGLPSVSDIVAGVYGGAVGRVAIAALSRTVADASREGNDTIARAILMRAGGALAQLAHGVTTPLFANETHPFPVCCVGGLWNAGPALGDVFARSLLRFAPYAVLTEPRCAPVYGAVLCALRADL